MRDFQTTQFLAMLRKEWLQSWPVLVLPLGFMALFVLAVTGQSQSRSIDSDSALLVGFWGPTVLAAVGLGVIGFGLEFQDRTANYLATRPVSLSHVLFAKAAIGVAFPLFFPIVFFVMVWVLEIPLRFPTEPVAHFTFERWWLAAPFAYLAAQFTVLLIPRMVPAAICAILAGVGAAAATMALPIILPLLMTVLLAALSFPLAKFRLRTG